MILFGAGLCNAYYLRVLAHGSAPFTFCFDKDASF
jgi:hypothetical protein